MVNIARGLTSEQVSSGHPDKIADQISDTLVDEFLKKDSNSRLAIETALKNNTVMVFGEVNTTADIDTERVVKSTLESIDSRYTHEGIDYINRLSEQSPDIALGTDDSVGGAGDQGIMVGYAVNEPEFNYLPKNYYIATKILKNLENDNRFGSEKLQFGTDAKSQVTLNEDGSVKTVLVSCQHPDNVTSYEVNKFLESSIRETLGDFNEHAETLLINPTGRFTIGGAWGDAGLTGRKVIADTYGSIGRHGGGAFSGKDPSKVDRSAAYFSRAAAKHIVKTLGIEWAEVRVAYAIGIPEPVELSVNCSGSVLGMAEAQQFVESLDWTPAGIDKTLGLRNWPGYHYTSVYGHFTEEAYPWEMPGALEGIN